MKFLYYLLFVNVAFGGGFHIPVHDASSTSRGNAVGATIAAPSSIYYNPAGLAGINESSYTAGVYVLNLDFEASLSSGEYSTIAETQYVPHLFLTQPLTEQLTAGFGVTVPFGLGTEWEDVPVTYFATKSSFSDVVYSLALGYEIAPNLRVGATLDIHDADFELGRKMAPNQLFPGSGGEALKLEGQDVSLGFSIGVQYDLSDQHHLGVTYRYAPSFDFSGSQSITGSQFLPDLSENVSVNGMNLPDSLSLSYNYTPNAHWNIGGGVEWVYWDQFDTYVTEGGQNALLIPFNWKTSLIYSIGATYYTSDDWAFSAGYVFNQSCQPDSETFNPSVSDADRHWLSCGVGKAWEHFSLDVAYQYSFSSRTISGADPLLRGDYDLIGHTFMLSLSCRL